MPGLVKSIAVREGQPVKIGEPLCVVEAMKMENTLTAERDATVKKILAKAGRLARGRRRDHGIRLRRGWAAGRGSRPERSECAGWRPVTPGEDAMLAALAGPAKISTVVALVVASGAISDRSDAEFAWPVGASSSRAQEGAATASFTASAWLRRSTTPKGG